MIKIDDFKAGGSQRKYITHTGVLPEIDDDVLTDEQKRKLIKKCYTMCDGYIAQPGEDEAGDDETTENEDEAGKTGEETQEPTNDPVDGEVSTEDDTKSE